MYHFRDVTLSFTKRKWQTYECPVHKAPWRGASPSLRKGWGWALPFTATSCYRVSYTARWSFFICCNIFIILHFIHPEMYHHSFLRTFIVWNIGPFGNMFVLILFFVERLQDYRITPLFMRPSSGDLIFPFIYDYI